MNLTAAVAAVAPRLSDASRQAWAEVLSSATAAAQINTPQRVAAFLGQAAHESGGFVQLHENLDYRAARLCEVWPSRFPNFATAAPYEHNPERIANRVYSGRLGNGDEASGDGWAYRGRGLFQITGAANYAAWYRAAHGLAGGDPVEASALRAWADTAALPTGAAASACWYWSRNGLNGLADGWRLTEITRSINGPACLGLDERKRLCNAALAVLS